VACLEAEVKRLVHMVSLGCPKARVDTEVMLGELERSGYVLSDDAAQAEAIVVTTCSFLQSAVEESIDTILALADHKTHGCCKRLVVVGCLPSRYGDELAVELPEVDVFLGVNELHRIAEVVAATPGRGLLAGDGLYRGRSLTTIGGSAYLKLAEGCDRRCSYCTIPQIRGPQRSREIASLVAEARRLGAQGVKELVLIAQDLTSYGTDLGDRQSLVRLLRELESLSEIAWVRLMYCYPWNFTDELLQCFEASGQVLRYVDMPLQHISERILRDMRRSVGRGAQEALVARLRSIPGMVLRSSMIVGFPGESEAEFLELVDWVRSVAFDRMGVFAYSAEPGTVAGERSDQVPEAERLLRRDHLMAVQQEIHRAKMREMIGSRLRVLVDGISEDHPLVYAGRYYGQAPEVDGVVYLSYAEGGEPAAAGEFVEVEVEDAADYDLVGLVLS